MKQNIFLSDGDDGFATPLHSCIPSFGEFTENHEKIMRVLLDAGADPCKQDFMERTPLHAAASKNNVAAIKILLEYGGEKLLNVMDTMDRTALDFAKKGNHVDSIELLTPRAL